MRYRGTVAVLFSATAIFQFIPKGNAFSSFSKRVSLGISRRPSTLPPINTLAPGANTDLKKVKVAMVLGYIGSNYHGLQYNPGEKAPPTIEKEVERALFKIGCILDSNYGSIDKISWARSSRTDKGVHAARVVLTMKLLVDPAWVQTDFTIPDVINRANAELPGDIKIFSCCKVRGGFRARESVNWR